MRKSAAGLLWKTGWSTSVLTVVDAPARFCWGCQKPQRERERQGESEIGERERDEGAREEAHLAVITSLSATF